jgi:hypothetical protein
MVLLGKAAMPDGIERELPTPEQCALGVLAAQFPGLDAREPELAWLISHTAHAEETALPDAPLTHLAARLALTRAETFAAALCRAVESDPMAGRALTRLQAPLAGSRPTLALVARAFHASVEQLAAGAALRLGVLTLHGDGPLPTRELAMPAMLHCALAGASLTPEGVRLDAPDIALPDALLDAARQQARALAETPGMTLVIRASSRDDARAAAAAIAREMGGSPAYLADARLPSLIPWIIASRHVAVLDSTHGPGERLTVPRLADLPLIVLAGPDGAVQAESGRLATWPLPLPDAADRARLWRAALPGCDADVATLGLRRMSAARIAALAHAAHHEASLAGREHASGRDVARAARRAAHPDGLAQAVDTGLDDAALVLAPTTRAELEALLARCRLREHLADDLGLTARARQRPGVAALFTGPSGTGKTLACAWLARRLGLPLWRVDIAAVTSKYIGETEKNLAQLLARAESEGVPLLFDEADALFGKRTEVRDANDRHANQQTNYLLQRIESFDGIAFITSNSRARFDAAFTRRIDAIVDFPAPGPEERRALWLAHLGEAHQLTQAEINRLAASADLTGGHIRNVVLAAAVTARVAARRIAMDDLHPALAAEYRKLGRQTPVLT